MSLKERFTPEDWSVITLAPHMVATAVMMASFSGLGGTAKEAFSLAQSLSQGMAGSDPLIKEVSAREELSTAQATLRTKTGALTGGDFKQQLNTMAVESARHATEILSQQMPDEVAPFKQWLMDTAYAVANASKEGDFFGIGGQRISDGERETLTQLSDALGVQPKSATAS